VAEEEEEDVQVETVRAWSLENVDMPSVATTPSSPTTTVVKEDTNIVTLTTVDGVQYRARKLVMTPSPHVIQNNMISFSPALPEEVVEAYGCTKMNNITKVPLSILFFFFHNKMCVFGSVLSVSSFLLRHVLALLSLSFTHSHYPTPTLQPIPQLR